MKATLSFGKIAYTNPNRKSNEVTIDIELRDCTTNAGYPYKELAICGNIWDSRGRHCVCCGQCLDELAEFIHEPIFKEIYDLWKKWHLNSLNAGTPEQNAAIDVWISQGNDYDYNRVKDMLNDLDLYAVYWTGHASSKDYDNEPYIYGTDWVIRELPENVIQRVTEIIKKGRENPNVKEWKS